MRTNQEKQALRFSVAIFTLMFGYAFVMNTTGMFMNGIIGDFKLFGAGQGSMSSMINAGGLLALLAVPWLQGRIKKRAMLILSVIIQIVSMLALGMIPFYWILLSMYLILGAGSSWLDSYANSAIADVNKENSPKYMGMLHGAFGIGAFISPFAIQMLLGVMTWRSAYWVVAGFIAVTALIFMGLTGHDGGYADARTEESKVRLGEVRDYLKNKENFMLISGGVMYAAAQMGLTVWIVRYMTLRYDRADLGAAALSVLWLTSTVSRIVAPRLKIRPLSMFIAGAVSIAVFQSFGLCVYNSFAFIAAFAAIGIFSGLCMPVIVSEVLKDYAGATSLPTSVLFVSMSVFRILMPLIMGYVSAASSITVGMFMPVIASVLSAAAIWAAVRIRRSRAA